MQIHNAIITGSFSYNGADLSNVTSSNAYSASLSSRTTDLESTSSVLVGASSSFSSILSSVSSSQQQISASLLQVSASYIALSGSYNTFSGSASTRVSQIEQVYATTGSNSFRATQSITGSLTVTGQIIAQTINVQQVTSSIIYSSGSNNFGCDLNSRQTFTGSVLITGSLTIAGASSATSYSGATIFGSTIACSPIGCFATSCATAFIGGTMSGTTIYGSTAVCSPVGKFTTCLDLGGALTGTSGTFSGILSSSGGDIRSTGTAADSVTAGPFISVRNASNAYQMLMQLNASYGLDIWSYGGAWDKRMTITSTGIACFACQVCAPNLLISNCATIGTVGFSYPEFRLAVTPIMTVVGAGCTPTSEGIYFKRTSNLCQGGWISGNGGALYLVGQNKHATAFGNIYFSSNNGTTTCDIMVIDGVNQRVGIGTTSPSYKLDIAGTCDAQMSLTAPSATGYNEIYFRRNTSTTMGYIGVGVNSTVTAAGDEFVIQNNISGGNIVFRTNSSGTIAEKMRITSNGYVLIPSAAASVQYFSMNYTSVDPRSRQWRIGSDQNQYGDMAISQATTQGGSTFAYKILIDCNGTKICGSLSKDSGSFRIKHPLTSKKCTHQLVHSFIEGPTADLIYRGKISLNRGMACVNIDCAARMTEGTFEALNRCAQVFTTNESSWNAIKGKLQGNILVIESQNTESNDEISWMVIGERQDEHMFETAWTDNEGRVITEPIISIKNIISAT